MLTLGQNNKDGAQQVGGITKGVLSIPPKTGPHSLGPQQKHTKTKNNLIRELTHGFWCYC